VNDPALLTPAYERYLLQALRRAFDLAGAPIQFDAVARNSPERDAKRPRRRA
jgi:predicted GTPase